MNLGRKRKALLAEKKMSNCNQIKTQIDRFTELDKQQRQNVQTHISSCQQCADYKAVADSTAGLLGSLGSTLKQMPSKDNAFKKLQQRAKKERSSTMVGLVGMFTSLFAGGWIYAQGDLKLVGAFVLLAWFCCSGIYVWWSSRKANKFGSVSSDLSSRFLADWKNELTREIKLVTVVASIISIEIFVVILSQILTSFSEEGALILSSINIILAIGVTYAFIIELPALKKELALIDTEI